MAGAKTGLEDLPFRADGIIAGQRFVKFGDATDSESCVQCDTAGEGVLGVAGGSVAAEHVGKKTIAVQCDGIAWVTAGGTVDLGDEVETDADGKAVAANGNTSAGVCMQGGDENDLILVGLPGVGAHEIAVGPAGS